MVRGARRRLRRSAGEAEAEEGGFPDNRRGARIAALQARTQRTDGLDLGAPCRCFAARRAPEPQMENSKARALGGGGRVSSGTARCALLAVLLIWAAVLGVSEAAGTGRDGTGWGRERPPLRLPGLQACRSPTPAVGAARSNFKRGTQAAIHGAPGVDGLPGVGGAAGAWSGRAGKAASPPGPDEEERDVQPLRPVFRLAEVERLMPSGVRPLKKHRRRRLQGPELGPSPLD